MVNKIYVYENADALWQVLKDMSITEDFRLSACLVLHIVVVVVGIISIFFAILRPKNTKVPLLFKLLMPILIPISIFQIPIGTVVIKDGKNLEAPARTVNNLPLGLAVALGFSDKVCKFLIRDNKE